MSFTGDPKLDYDLLKDMHSTVSNAVKTLNKIKQLKKERIKKTMMDKIQKGDIKKKAEKLAAFLGYNINSANLDVINVQEAYCQGYAQALEDFPQLFQMDKWVAFRQRLIMECGMPHPDGVEIRELLSELESFGKPTGEAKELK